MSGKPKRDLDSVFKNQTNQKFDIRSDSFRQKLHAVRHSSKKVNKSNFTCTECADKEHFKTRPKRSTQILEFNYIIYLSLL